MMILKQPNFHLSPLYCIIPFFGQLYTFPYHPTQSHSAKISILQQNEPQSFFKENSFFLGLAGHLCDFDSIPAQKLLWTRNDIFTGVTLSSLKVWSSLLQIRSKGFPVRNFEINLFAKCAGSILRWKKFLVKNCNLWSSVEEEDSDVSIVRTAVPSSSNCKRWHFRPFVSHTSSALSTKYFSSSCQCYFLALFGSCWLFLALCRSHWQSHTLVPFGSFWVFLAAFGSFCSFLFFLLPLSSFLVHFWLFFGIIKVGSSASFKQQMSPFIIF